MFNNRTLMIRVGLVLVVLVLMWTVFGRSQPGSASPSTRISYSEMLSYIDLGSVVTARYDASTGELVAVVKPPSLPAPVKDAVPDTGRAAPANPAAAPPPSASAASDGPPLPTKPAASVPPSTIATAMASLATRTVSTVLPPTDTDTLQRLARQADLTLAERPKSSPWGMLAMAFLPMLLLIGFMWWMMKRGAGNGPNSQALGFGKSRVQALDPATNTVRFVDVAGCDEAKAEVAELTEFLKNPSHYARVGGKMPHGVLLAGPPGTGKTLLAKAIAGEAGVPFFFTSGSDFVEMFVGVGAARVRDTFAQAKAQAPSIIFVDEIDAVGRQRSSGPHGSNDEREQTLNALLVEMDGFKGNEGVIVIAATNRADMLDEALRRPGRFDREVNVGLPDRLGRAQILEVHARTVPVDTGVDWDIIARGTPGFSGAELASLINEAALAAARGGQQVVTMAHLEWARDRVMMGAEKLSGLKNPKERRITAYHEAGHALVARFIEGADPVHKITIVPRGRSLGLTMQLPKEDATNYEREELMTRIAVLMGGRAAEEVALQMSTAGASNDFARAAALARRMVATWGMDEQLGPVSFDGEYGAIPGQNNGWSETWKKKVDDTVVAILREKYRQACQILRDNRALLDAVGEALLERETLDAEQFEQLVQPLALPAPA